MVGTRLAQDGQFGDKTRAALIKVQQWEQISADGVYGPQTARAMGHQIIGSTLCGRITF